MPLTKSETSAITQQIANFAPKRILEVELGQPLPAISAFDNKTGRCYQRVLCLVRLHTQPLGIVELRIEENEMSAHKLAEHLWQALQKPINQHLDQDGLPGVAGLDVAGLSCSGLPQCLEERHNFLAHAPFVSIVVSTRDRPESMQSCLRSLLALQYPAYEIIVVDNAPTTNATADLIQQTYGNVSRVRYLREDRPGLRGPTQSNTRQGSSI